MSPPGKVSYYQEAAWRSSATPRLLSLATNSTTACELGEAAPCPAPCPAPGPAHLGAGGWGQESVCHPHTLYTQWTLWRSLPGCGQGPPAATSAGEQSSPGAEAGLGTAPSVCAKPPARTPAGPTAGKGQRASGEQDSP